MKTRGMTTVELLVTLVIASILVAMGAPAFKSVLLNNRATTFAGDMISYLNLARSEAIKRGQAVSLCAASTTAQTACATQACANADNPGPNCWSNGWIVFVDPDMNGIIANQDDRIKIREALESGQTVVTPNFSIVYSPEGFLAQGAGNYLMTVPGCTGNAARQLQLSAVGRVTASAAACSS